MELFGFEKETLLDLTVNVIPLAIILFFIAVFAVLPAFGTDPVFSGMQFALMVAMFLLLAVLTYWAGHAVQSAEQEAEADALAAGDEHTELDAGEEGTELETDDDAELEAGEE